MPRQARLDYPGAYHHVMGRGIDGHHIFIKDSSASAGVQKGMMIEKKKRVLSRIRKQ